MKLNSYLMTILVTDWGENIDEQDVLEEIRNQKYVACRILEYKKKEEVVIEPDIHILNTRSTTTQQVRDYFDSL